MRRHLTLLALLILPAALAAQPAPRTLVLTNVHVIDGTGAAPQRNVQVVSTGARLLPIGASPVRINASRGVDVIKTRGTERAGLAEQDPRKQVYDTEQLRAIVAEAGAHILEHGTYLSDSTLALMQQRGTYLVPTYATVVDLTLPGGEYDTPLLQLRGRHMLPRLQETVRCAHALGVPLITGGDTNYGPEGVTRIAHEVGYFVELGLTPIQALRSATAVAADALGIADRTGTLTVGRESDYVLVDRNPLEDITALQDVLLVVADGRVAVKRIPFALSGRE
jgi:imidazolonepropionase-like amidohydrolase